MKKKKLPVDALPIQFSEGEGDLNELLRTQGFIMLSPDNRAYFVFREADAADKAKRILNTLRPGVFIGFAKNNDERFHLVEIERSYAQSAARIEGVASARAALSDLKSLAYEAFGLRTPAVEKLAAAINGSNGIMVVTADHTVHLCFAKNAELNELRCRKEPELHDVNTAPMDIIKHGDTSVYVLNIPLGLLNDALATVKPEKIFRVDATGSQAVAQKAAEVLDPVPPLSQVQIDEINNRLIDLGKQCATDCAKYGVLVHIDFPNLTHRIYLLGKHGTSILHDLHRYRRNTEGSLTPLFFDECFHATPHGKLTRIQLSDEFASEIEAQMDPQRVITVTGKPDKQELLQKVTDMLVSEKDALKEANAGVSPE